MVNETQQTKTVRMPVIDIPATITVGDLALLVKVDPVDVIKEFMRSGFMFTINEVIDHESATTIAAMAGYHVRPLAEAEDSQATASMVISTEGEVKDNLTTRPPVVTILGHVDHGKTTLLDRIRRTNVVDHESGGITQHIGAYQIHHDQATITFLDTPGHEAFTEMRARGARVTDFAVLVVAADDGIMPQTLEAINHIKAAEVQIIVAINKIDKPDADLERVKRQLSENDLLIEEWGGDVIAVPVSALTGEGLDDLLGNIQVLTEVSELMANPNRLALGVVIEARVDNSMGNVATILIQTGTLNVGDSVVTGEFRGRIRAMFSDQGDKLTEAGPSQPVRILGLSGLPRAGDTIEAVEDEKSAKTLVESRIKAREAGVVSRGGVTLQEIHTRIKSGDIKALNLIVKTDVQGCLEAVRAALESLNTEQTRVNFIHTASGTITESDVMLASASSAIVVGFNTRSEPGATSLSRQMGVELRSYEIIYNLVDDMERALSGLLEPEVEDVLEGTAVVRAVFGLGRRHKAAGFYVTNGRMLRTSTFHVLRRGTSIFEGAAQSLKRFKDDVREVANGFEGGIALQGFDNFQEGDVLESHTQQES